MLLDSPGGSCSQFELVKSGFDDAGASAAEIKTPSEIYPKAFFGAKNDDFFGVFVDAGERWASILMY